MMSDPIADMLTRVRNGVGAGFREVRIPHSILKQKIAEVMKAEGYCDDVRVEEIGGHKELVFCPKYDENNKPVIRGLMRQSLSGRRLYLGSKKLPKTLGGFGITIVTTSKGVMTDREARKQKLGGEVLASVW